jgi:superfamily II DNA or RNA helicase
MTDPLRPYHQRALDALRAVWQRNPVLVAPTGSGKTTIAAHLVAGAVGRGRRVLFLAHRKELIDQAAVRFLGYVPDVGIVKAGITPTPAARVQVASVQTLVNRTPPPADVVVIDECHHATAATYQTILGWYPTACRVGLTATPFRTDGTGLGSAGFGDLVVAATPQELIDEGSLLEPRVFEAVETPDLKGVRTTGGDFAPGELALRVDTPKLIGDIVEAWKTYAADRLTVVFACTVAHSRHIVEQFGDIAAHLDGTTPADERDAILERFAAGDIRIVSNYGVLTEGWDVPAAGACVLARPTKSLGLFLQMAGQKEAELGA